MILLKKVLSKKIFPLHARVMDFFDTVDEKRHQCAMDNIYNSDDFLKAAYNNEKYYSLMVLGGKEREAYHHALDGLYISTHLNNWCHLFH